ncbi:hypothetical protein HMN09_00260700 [Mycena chlorophos]|uniref:DUF7223 domain-containing protein n=1 Tax=Mycena chlorophos TaxID=658473 RepID=A0A8H6WLL0_MYCCL|nr:hypothetical protein HMN09_00260700 [Mycena chlorophos]
MRSTTLALFTLATAVSVHAKNDWSVPCLFGSCSYDLPSTSNASASFKIWGSASAISDITPAAGWQILDCDPSLNAQSIRLVCVQGDANDTSSNCAHLYQNDGPVNKLVRLPEDCGSSAFARVASSSVSPDQTLPSSLSRRLAYERSLAGRNAASSSAPIVRSLTLDTNWTAVSWSKNGMVNIALQGVNAPGLDVSDIDTSSATVSRRSGPTSASRRRSEAIAKRAAKAVIQRQQRGEPSLVEMQERGFLGGLFSKAESIFSDATSAVVGVATEAASAVESVATEAASAVVSVATEAASDVESIATKVATAAKNAASEVKQATSFNHTHNFDIAPINFNKSANLINSDLSCAGADLSLSVDIAASASDLQAVVAATAAGTLVPPSFNDFSVIGMFTGAVGGAIDITADITGSISSGSIQIFTVGIPGLDIPDILQLGPTFDVNAEIDGVVDIQMEMQIGVNLDLANTTIAFPPDAKNKVDSNSLSLADTPLTLNTAADVQAQGTLVATLTPSLQLGLSAFGGKIAAEVFLAMAASAQLDLNLDASIATQKTRNGGARKRSPVPIAKANDKTSSKKPSADSKKSSTTTASEKSKATTASTVVAANSATVDTTAESDAASVTSVLSDDASVTSGSVDTTDETVDDSATTTADESEDTTSVSAAANSTAADASESASVESTASTVVSTTGSAANNTSTVASVDSASVTANSTTGTEDQSDASIASTSANSTISSAPVNRTAEIGDNQSSTTKSLGGCVNVTANINLNVGAQGSFFDLFNDVASKTLFTKTFDIFAKCFGDDATAANSTDASTSGNSTTTDTDSTDASDTASISSVTSTSNTTTTSTRRRRSAARLHDRRPRLTRRFTRFNRRASRSDAPTSTLELQRRLSLSCPIGGSTALTGITSGTILGGDIASSAQSLL